MPFNKRIK